MKGGWRTMFWRGHLILDVGLHSIDSPWLAAISYVDINYMVVMVHSVENATGVEHQEMGDNLDADLQENRENLESLADSRNPCIYIPDQCY